MFYLESNKGIINILSNIFLDYHENKIKSTNIKDLFEWIINNENNFADMISGITATKDPLCLLSINRSDKFFTNITLDEIIKVKNKIPYMGCDLLRKDFTKDFNRIYRNLPFNIVSLYDKKINKSLELISVIKNNKINSNEIIYQNNRDSVLYLTDIDNLDKDIEISKKSGIFTLEELANLYSITLRIIIPKYISDMIHCDHKDEFLYKSNDTKILFSNKSTCDKNVYERRCNCQNEIRFITDEGTRNRDSITLDTLHKVYINMTIKELSDLINNLSDIEFNYENQVIGAIYYNLINFSNINSLFSIDQNIKKDIEKRIYTRRGN